MSASDKLPKRSISIRVHKQVKDNINHELKDLIESGRVKVIIIPAIESVNYGRKVGYEINEFVPPEDINDISATKIRKNLNLD